MRLVHNQMLAARAARWSNIQAEVSWQPRNHVLTALRPATKAQLRPHLQLITLDAGLTLYRPESALDFVYFPETCVATRLALLEDGATVEIGLLGYEGVIGAAAVLGATCARNVTLVEIGGAAYRMCAGLFVELARRDADLFRGVAQAYQHLFQMVSQRAVCRSRHSVLAQLSTWLLMLQDRVAVSGLALTQETIAGRLGVRRAGVTVAANELKRQGALSYTRGQIEITNRRVIERLACDCYEQLRAHSQETSQTWARAA